MLKVELTKNYGGVIVSGDFDDLNNLYDSISYLIRGESDSLGEYIMQGHIYGFLYDLRHSYQGDREVELVDNGLQENKREWYGFKKRDITENNLYFSFNYLLTDVFLDMILIKFFIRKLDKKLNNVYNPNINMVNYFYSLVLYSLDGFISENKFNKVKRGMDNAFIFDKLFIPQWFEIISIDYAKMNKNEREKKFMKIMDAIYNYINYEDYYILKRKLEKECAEKNCNLDNLHYDDYPEEIEW